MFPHLVQVGAEGAVRTAARAVQAAPRPPALELAHLPGEGLD